MFILRKVLLQLIIGRLKIATVSENSRHMCVYTGSLCVRASVYICVQQSMGSLCVRASVYVQQSMGSLCVRASVYICVRQSMGSLCVRARVYDKVWGPCV